MITVFLGLGNIGSKYRDTRHNIGFMVIDKLIDKFKLTVKQTKIYDLAELSQSEHKYYFVKPKLYMNRSGEAARALLHDIEAVPSQIAVIVDDVYLPLGAIRIRRSGSDGGHNGLASLIEQLETEDFPRLRLGIGQPDEEIDLADYVLQEFEEDELTLKNKLVNLASEAIEFLIENDLEEAMAKYNSNPA